MNISEYLEYVGNDWAKGWLQRSLNDRKGVFVAQAYMHMVNGNSYDALLLGQVIYWSDISQETLKPRISHGRQGHLWIVKTHKEWAEETSINGPETIKKAFNRLVSLNLVIKEQHRSPFHDQVVSYVRVNWDVFSDKLQKWANQTSREDTSEAGKVQQTQPGEVQGSHSGGVQESPSGQAQNTSPYTETVPENNSHQENPLVASATGEPAALADFDPQDQINASTVNQVMPERPERQTQSADEPPALVSYLYGFSKKPLTKAQLRNLSTGKVIQTGAGTLKCDAPNDLFVTDPRFKEYVDEMVKACKRMNNDYIVWNTLIGLICNFERVSPGQHGWIEWQKSVPLPGQAAQHPLA